MTSRYHLTKLTNHYYNFTYFSGTLFCTCCLLLGSGLIPPYITTCCSDPGSSPLFFRSAPLHSTSFLSSPGRVFLLLFSSFIPELSANISPSSLCDTNYSHCGCFPYLFHILFFSLKLIPLSLKIIVLSSITLLHCLLFLLPYSSSVTLLMFFFLLAMNPPRAPAAVIAPFALSAPIPILVTRSVNPYACLEQEILPRSSQGYHNPGAPIRLLPFQDQPPSPSKRSSL